MNNTTQPAVNINTEQELEKHLTSGDLPRAREIIESIEPGAISDIKQLLQFSAVYRGLGDQPRAVEFSAMAANLHPDNAAVLLVYAQNLLILGDIDQSEAVLNEISAQTPEMSKQVQLHRSMILYQRKDFRATTKLLVDLVKQNPTFAAAHLELGHSLLMDGKWRAGWIEYEWRFELPKSKNQYPRFKMPYWDGSANTPHLLLLGDQGYGDCFQFSRYIPMVRERCKRISLARSDPLARLFNISVPWVDMSYTQWKDTPAASAYCALSSLPRFFATQPDTIPDNTGILRARDDDITRWKKQLDDMGTNPVLRIGLAWSGRLEFDTNFLRAVPFEILEPLLDIPGVEFYSLQVGAPSEQAKGKKITDLSLQLHDFAETAAVMEALDLVITSDTSIAHLAGALDRPTWVLLSYAPDWRWGAKGSSSPWYSGMQLFRQDQDRRWQSTVDKCKLALLNIINTEDPRASLAAATEENYQNGTNPYL